MDNLKKIFPQIRERKEVLADINSKKALFHKFNSWTDKQQEEFLEICTGERGIKVLSDSFFKEIVNPEFTPERMNDFLSVILKQKVKILHVLPNESVRLATEGTLLITDLVVELEDGSIINIEVQRIGYKFPGERAACYSADLLLRQYKRVRDQKEKMFIYKDIKPVYTVILFEKSPKEFHKFPNQYLHYMEAKSDTGLDMNLLQKYIFIPLDIFRKRSHNELIENKLEAWLTFFSTDEPKMIERLITTYPQFKTMYEDAYEMCLNVERMMGMFSKELQILDENTVQYMMDEMQEEINGKKKELNEKRKELNEKNKELNEKKKELNEIQGELDKRKEIINEQQILIKQLQEQLKNKENTSDNG